VAFRERFSKEDIAGRHIWANATLRIKCGRPHLMREICMSGCASSEGWLVQQETDLPGQESEAP
jgi:hypothetical protein